MKSATTRPSRTTRPATTCCSITVLLMRSLASAVVLETASAIEVLIRSILRDDHAQSKTESAMVIPSRSNCSLSLNDDPTRRNRIMIWCSEFELVGGTAQFGRTFLLGRRRQGLGFHRLDLAALDLRRLHMRRDLGLPRHRGRILDLMQRARPGDSARHQHLRPALMMEIAIGKA